MFSILSKLLNSNKPVFYAKEIDVTKDILGIYAPTNAPAVAKAAAANLIKKEMKKIFDIPRQNTEFKYEGGTIIFFTEINSIVKIQ
jgi:hypothetical protein